MKYIEDLTQLTEEALGGERTTVFEEIKAILAAAKKQVEELIPALNLPITVKSVDAYDNRVWLTIDEGNGITDDMYFYTECDDICNDAPITRYCISSPYSSGTIVFSGDMTDKDIAHLTYYKVFGIICSNSEFLTAIRNIQSALNDEIVPLNNYRYLVQGELREREHARLAEQKQKERDEYYNSIMPALTDPANSEKYVACVNDCKTGITYRGKTVKVCKKTDGTCVFDTEDAALRSVYKWRGDCKTEDEITDCRTFSNSTLIQIRMLKDEKTGKWLNRPKK